MSKFTAPQLKALKSAVDTGNAWNAWGSVYRASTDRMMKALCAKGLLTHDGRPTDKTENALGIPAAYGSVVVGSEVVSLADDEFYQCEIPGTPGRVTVGGVDITPKATGGFVDLKFKIAGAPACQEVTEFGDAVSVGYLIEQGCAAPPPTAFEALLDRAVNFIAGSRGVPAYIISGALPVDADEAAGTAFLENRARQMGVGLHIQIIGRGLRFSPTIYYPKGRKGIKKIVVKKKGVDLGPWA